MITFPDLLHRPSRYFVACLLLGLLAACTQVDAQPQPLSVSVYFGNNSVWQRDQAIQLRGAGQPGSRVSFASDGLGESVATVDEDGTWRMRLSPKPAGGPYSYTLRSGKDQVIVREVYLGDVFLCSGQSNMEWPVAMTTDAPRALERTDPLLHHLAVPHVSVADVRAEPAAQAFWQTVYPGRTEGFTAIGFYFAEALRERYPDLAVGIINVSWGGSRIEAWLPEAEQGLGLVEITAANRITWDGLRVKYPEAFRDPKRRLSVTPERPGDPIGMGSHWEGHGFPEVDGSMWFDRTVNLSDRQVASGAALLSLGPIDDSDSTYVNGRLVGSTYNKYTEARRYALPTGLLKAGANTINIRVDDTGGGGGLTAPTDSLYLQTGIGRVALGDGWTVRPEHIRYDSLGAPNQVPRYLFNGMLASLDGVAAKGVLWYQGESNAGNPADAGAYASQINDLVQTFRKQSGQPALPFIAVELPEFMPATDDAYQTYAFWPTLRQSTRTILDLPATSTVVPFGYGDALDIHPRDKRPVAQLLYEDMMRLAYSESDGPTTARASGLRQAGPALVVEFVDSGKGFKTTDDAAIRGFAVQDSEGLWYHAEADAIDDSHIRLVGPSGKTYRAVAYAWSNNPDEANLINGYGRRVGSFKLSLDE